MSCLYSPELHVGQVKSAATLERIFKGGLFIIENLSLEPNRNKPWDLDRALVTEEPLLHISHPGASAGKMSNLVEAFSPDGIL